MSNLLLPCTEVEARGLRWEVVDAQILGPQAVYRLRRLAGVVRSMTSQAEALQHLQTPLLQEQARAAHANSAQDGHQGLRRSPEGDHLRLAGVTHERNV